MKNDVEPLFAATRSRSSKRVFFHECGILIVLKTADHLNWSKTATKIEKKSPKQVTNATLAVSGQYAAAAVTIQL